MDTLFQSDTINAIQGKCKHDLIQNILEESSHYLKGSQLMELNRTLNKHFEGYEIFVSEKEAYRFVGTPSKNEPAVELNPVKSTGSIQSTLM